ncbi:MAG: hypothetical protein OSJ46_06430 [Duncaniella sp.]|nr:hypothetical protein [Duncaniella sp.]
MKKKILGLALIAMSCVTFGSMAQTPSVDNARADQKDLKGMKCVRQECKALNPFEGMNLTEAQQTQLQQLDAKRKAARQEQVQARKVNKQKKDSARMADRRAAKKAYLDEVKAIVGPENYVVFLENVYVNGGGHRDGGKAAFRQHKNHKAQGDRKGKRHAHHAFNKVNKSSDNTAKSDS